MNLEFTVTETITRERGQINEIHYEVEELTVENISLVMAKKRERRSRIFNANITRKQYNGMTKTLPCSLSFDNFIHLLRLFIMGYYCKSELDEAFAILDKDQSGSISIDRLVVFLPIINEYATAASLKRYFQKVDMNKDGRLNYEAFQSMILRGIGRDMICNHM